jgi:uncharacterized protein (TIGR02284 family)
VSNEDVVEVLNELLETCYDGLNGFRTAASQVQSREAIALCESRAQRIDEAAAELFTAIHHLGGHPADHGHAAAQVHRGWIHLRAYASGSGDDAVLAEVERGEELAVRRYQHALGKPLPPDIKDLVADQASGAEESLERVRELRRRS